MAKASYDAPAVRHATRLFALLCHSPVGLGVSEIAQQLGINKNLAFRLLTTLREEGWISADEPGPKYRPTLHPFALASQPVQRLTVRTAAAEPLRQLWTKHGESTYLGIRYEDTVLYLEHFDCTKSVRIAGMVGGRYPLHCTAPGKALLAFATERISLSNMHLEKFTANTLTAPADLERELEAIRQRGYALDNEEFGRGLLCLAAPIFDHEGQVFASLGCSVTTITYTLEKLATQLGPDILAAAREASHRLGFFH